MLMTSLWRPVSWRALEIDRQLHPMSPRKTLGLHVRCMQLKQLLCWWLLPGIVQLWRDHVGDVQQLGALGQSEGRPFSAQRDDGPV